ncbi:MAG TPA: exodeoxyribonuclease VII large subunit [Candidatus Polarisedimenticolia bacterium]|nr:exodeoxyribonuclease VII large subunit [Candidatus Polarisedimenticolia bacterium]
MKDLFDTADRTPPVDPARDRQVLSVSQLNALVRGLLEDNLPSVWIEGEISNLRRYPSGHTYFTLKDAEAQVAAVLFRGSATGLRFRPEDGLKVLVRGRVSLYEARGSYQVIVEAMEPAGLGALQLAFEQLKAKLLAEGLFDPSRKRPIPALPRRVGIVTSPAGAALRDILKVLDRRFAALEVVIAPSRVQGEEAAGEIVAALRDLQRLGGLDVVIVTRGGGSLEDLWPFNEEVVARAIAACRVPVISAVGHEVDGTIADLVADLRAPTPSAAAEMVVRSRAELVARIAADRARLLSAARLALSRLRQALGAAGAEGALESVRARLRDAMLRVDDLTSRLRDRIDRLALASSHRLEILAQRMTPRRLAERLEGRRASAGGLGRLLHAVVESRLRRERDRMAAYGERLQALSPLAVLARGYAICRLEPGGEILSDAGAARPGDAVEVRLHRGRLGCEVKEVSDVTPEEGI